MIILFRACFWPPAWSGWQWHRLGHLASRSPVDRIVAVVNDEVITQHELRSRLDSALGQLQRQGMPLPPRNVLEKQMLERLVMDKVQLQQARDMGLRIDDTQLEQALQRIAAGNNLSLAQFRAALEKDGIAFASFREEIRAEMTIARLREREVESKIFISDGEVDNYLAGASGREVPGKSISWRISCCERPSRRVRSRFRSCVPKPSRYSTVQKGRGFCATRGCLFGCSGRHEGRQSRLAFARSPADTMFAEASLKLKVGEVSPVLRSSNGFHLIKLLAKRGGGAAQAVEQTHARHILIKVNEVVSESEARHKLEGLQANGSSTVKALPSWPGFSRRTGRRPKAAILAGSTLATPFRSSSGR
jgi:peptidyl-prolyl cis-trans isomerase SurA